MRTGANLLWRAKLRRVPQHWQQCEQHHEQEQNPAARLSRLPQKGNKWPCSASAPGLQSGLGGSIIVPKTKLFS